MALNNDRDGGRCCCSGHHQSVHEPMQTGATAAIWVTLDSTLSNLNPHVTNVCKSAYFHLQALKHIRPVLTNDMANSIVALVQSRLDYANSILYHTSSYNISKLQRVQNMAARLVVSNKHLSSSDYLSYLHWLPVCKRIDFKIATLTYKLLNHQQPA